MRRSCLGAIAAIAFGAVLLGFPALSAGQTGTTEIIGPPSDPAVTESFIQALAPRGYRVLSGGASAPIDIWFRKEIPAVAKPAANSDAVYDRLSETTLIGVLHFSKNSNDYRGQSVAAGYYSLRYALMPNDGNHMGVAPGRDFVLLSPIGVDPGPQKTLTTKELMVLSRQAAGTKHPAPMSLVPAQSDGSKPALTRDDEGDVVFTASLHLSSGEELPIALIVRGTAPQ